MATAGMYEASGDWLFDVGVPGKSGIGGGIIAVSPGKGGLGTFPRSWTAPGQRQGTAGRAPSLQNARIEPVRIKTAPRASRRVMIMAVAQ